MMAVCGTTAAHSTYCTDALMGYEGEISGIDNFKYRYYTTGLISDAVTMPYTTSEGAISSTGENYYFHTFIGHKVPCNRICVPLASSLHAPVAGVLPSDVV